MLKGLKTFKERNTRFISIPESIDTNSPPGVALYTILGALAQLKREMIIERVRAGVANAKAKGKRIGRVKKRNSVLIRSCWMQSCHIEKLQGSQNAVMDLFMLN